MSRVRKRRIRKSTKATYIILLMFILIFAISQFILMLQENELTYKKKEIYNYTNDFSYNYEVNLIKNKYIDKTSLGMNEQAYITDLIDNITLDLKYMYSGSETSEVEYKYSVVGKLAAVYTRDGEEQKILEKDYNLLDEKEGKSNNKEVKIDEEIQIDLKDKNSLIKDFEQNMNMSVDATYTVVLNLETTTNIEGEKVENKINPKIVIDIGKKTTKISGENNQNNTEYVTIKVAENNRRNDSYLIAYGVVAVIAVIALRYVITKTEVTVIIRNEYRQEINRILRLCQDKIVQVKSKPDLNKDKLIEVKDFGELVKLSEELYKPILFWENKEKTESWFIVMSNNTIYKYAIKKD